MTAKVLSTVGSWQVEGEHVRPGLVGRAFAVAETSGSVIAVIA